MSWIQQHTDCLCAMPTITPIFSSQGSSQGSSFKRTVPASNVSTTLDKKRKADGPLFSEPAVAQRKTVATLLNPLSATSLEPNGPWFTPLDAPTQVEARPKSAGDTLRKDGAVGSNHHSDESISSAPRPQTISQQQKARIEYREATKVLQKLDVLSIATSRMQSMIEDIKKTTEDIDAIMGAEATSFPPVTTKPRENCQELVRCYEERLTVLTQWSGDTNMSGEK